MEARTVSVGLNQTHNKWDEIATMQTVQITNSVWKTKQTKKEWGGGGGEGRGHKSINTTNNGKEIFRC